MTDVVIIGGGLSGALFARHLTRTTQAKVVIIEERTLPVPEGSTHLGESTTETGAWYLGEFLGLEPHLRSQHTAKFGLRFFLSRPKGTPFHQRAEFGIHTLGGGYCSHPFDGTRPPTWQLDRARLDRHLYFENLADGVEILDGCKVLQVVPGAPHRVKIDGQATRSARWVIDASRSGVLTEHLGELEPVGHRYQATWTWLDARLDPDKLSSEAEFRDRVPRDLRWRSTNHWVGPGYWIWGIPLADRRTSIGIVGHEDLDLPQTSADWLSWLQQHEPEVAAQVKQIGMPDTVHHRRIEATHAPTLLDNRLARVGDAAGFLDPLYSSALDHLALNGQLLAAAIQDDLRGQPLERRVRFTNVLHQQITGHYQHVYRGLYDTFADPRLCMAKITWDNAMYFSVLTPILCSEQVTDDDFLQRYGGVAQRSAQLQERMQQVFRHWSRLPSVPATGVVDVAWSPHLLRPLTRLRDRAHNLEEALAIGIAELEELAIGLLHHAAACTGTPLPAGPLNPYQSTLDPHQLDGLTRGRLHALTPRMQVGLEATRLSTTP